MNFNKVTFFHKAILQKYFLIIALLSSFTTLALAFISVPEEYKFIGGIIFIIILILLYICLWIKANNTKDIKLDIEGSQVIIKTGDIFKENGLKVIAFNEYFDTQVDDRIIANKSLNGIFIKKYFEDSLHLLDNYIDKYRFEEESKLEDNTNRQEGKIKKFKIGTVCLYKDFIFTAFTKFDDKNQAILTMPEYLKFLIKFWDEMNRVYAQRDVAVPIFGSGITRIKEHKNISDEELLKIMLWTFRISEMKFKHPAKLTIVIHYSEIDRINLSDIEMAKNGL